MRYIEAHTTLEAKEILIKEKIQYDRICVEMVPSLDRYTGKIVHRDGIHVYFMLKDYDVAYFTPLMKCLGIHDEPRPWDYEIMENLRELKEHEDL